MKSRTHRKRTPKSQGVLNKIKNFFMTPANNTKKAVQKQFYSIKKQSYKQFKKMKR